MTRRKKIILGAVLSFILIVILAGVLAAVLFPADRVRSMVESGASEALGMPVRVGELGLSFWGMPSVRAADVTVGPARPGEPPLAAVKSIRVRVGLLPLLRRQVDITSLTVDEPVVNLLTRADGSSNMPAVADSAGPKEPSGAPSLPVPVSLRSFRINDGTVSLINEKDQTRTVLEDISQRLSLRITRDLTTLRSSGELEAGNIELWSRGKRQPLSGSMIRLTHEVSGNAAEGNLTLTEGELAFNGIPVKLTGELTGWKSATFHAETGTLEAGRIVASLPDSLLPNKKDVAADGEVSLVLDGSAGFVEPEPVFRYTGELAIRDVSASVEGFPKRIDRFNGVVGITEQTLTLRDMEVRIDRSRAALAGTVSGYLENPVLAVRTEGVVNMEDIASAMPFFTENRPTGTVTFDLAVTGSPSPEITALEPSGSLTLNNLTMSLPEALKNPATLNGTVRLSPRTVGINDLTFKSGKSDLAVNGALTGYLNLLPGRAGGDAVLKGVVGSTLLDLNDLLVTRKEAPLLKPWDLDEPLKHLPVPPSLQAEMGVKLNTVLFGRLKADSVQGTVTFRNGVLELSRLNAAAYDGALTGSTSVNFSNPEQIVYSGGFNLARLNAQTFISSFFGTGEHFRGQFSSAFTFNGSGLDSLSFLQNLKAEGSAVFENGQVVNWEFLKQLGQRLRFLSFDTLGFGNIQGAFRVADRKVITPNILAKTEYGDFTAVGTTGFDGAVDYTILLDLNNRAVDLAAKNKLGDLAGIIASSREPELRVAATGTLKKPSFKIDASSVRENVKQKLREEAEKLLEGEDSDLQQKGRKLLDRIFK